jgi:hypothetical protein
LPMVAVDDNSNTNSSTNSTSPLTFVYQDSFVRIPDDYSYADPHEHSGACMLLH